MYIYIIYKYHTYVYACVCIYIYIYIYPHVDVTVCSSLFWGGGAVGSSGKHLPWLPCLFLQEAQGNQDGGYVPPRGPVPALDCGRFAVDGLLEIGIDRLGIRGDIGINMDMGVGIDIDRDVQIYKNGYGFDRHQPRFYLAWW